jgi:hypothetical protein
VNLLVLVVLIEVGTVGFYFFKKREFFYTRSKESVADTRAHLEPPSQASGNEVGSSYQLHPYFGFIGKEAYGNLPYKRANNNQVIIGIFGGSVAVYYYVYELEHRVLLQALQRLPQFKNREIVILRFCHEAYKQPQQLLVLNYFLSIGQEFDMVINIDGFNELHLANINNRDRIDFSMPVDFLLMPLVDLADKDLSSDQLDLALEVMQIKHRLRDSLDKMTVCKLAACYASRWAQAKYLLARYQTQSVAFNAIRNPGLKNSLVHVNKIDKPLGDSEVLDKAVDEWANASRTMYDILAANKVEYFEFIQPNQYYPTNRQFGEEERKIAIIDDPVIKHSIAEGYSKLLARVPSLKDHGVRVLSGVGIFDEARGIVYTDNCCHYNQAGLGILSDYIARSVVAVQETQAVPFGKRKPS